MKGPKSGCDIYADEQRPEHLFIRLEHLRLHARCPYVGWAPQKFCGYGAQLIKLSPVATEFIVLKQQLPLRSKLGRNTLLKFHDALCAQQ